MSNQKIYRNILVLKEESSSRKRYSFSLLEILIGFALLTVITTLCLVQVYRGSEITRFKTSVDRVKDTLSLAWNLSRITQGEVRVVFEEEDKAFWISLDADRLESSALKKIFSKKEPLDAVAHIELKDASKQERQHEKLILRVLPIGVQSPEATLVIQAKNPTDIHEEALLKYSFSQQDQSPLLFYPEEISSEKEAIGVHST